MKLKTYTKERAIAVGGWFERDNGDLDHKDEADWYLDPSRQDRIVEVSADQYKKILKSMEDKKPVTIIADSTKFSSLHFDLEWEAMMDCNCGADDLRLFHHHPWCDSFKKAGVA